MSNIAEIKIVYGPPCGGKSTFVQGIMKENDIKFDFDLIMQAVTQKNSHTYTDIHLPYIIEFRRLIIKKSQTDEKISNVYIIVSKLTDKLLDELDGIVCEYIRVCPDIETVYKHMKNDKSRKDKEEWKRIIDNWFQWDKEFDYSKIDNLKEVKVTGKAVSKMKIEVRADGAHISGYVNVTGKKSRPVITPHGRCIEVIEERAFESALGKSGDVSVTVDHNSTHIYASTGNSTLKLYEDNIGLHADVLIIDPDLVELAKKRKIRGWSFGMRNVVDELEQRADDLPIRHVKDFTLDHITLVVNKLPVYAATSVEVRADDESLLECRALDTNVEIVLSEEPLKTDYSDYENRIKALKTVI